MPVTGVTDSCGTTRATEKFIRAYESIGSALLDSEPSRVPGGRTHRWSDPTKSGAAVRVMRRTGRPPQAFGATVKTASVELAGFARPDLPFRLDPRPHRVIHQPDTGSFGSFPLP
ncbi:hypothetical protein BB31_16110 [Amycolatopsis lurida NRRL 2430]|uniref:Uncharacterized protein n=1 Tax=Amycolatopsis lurida NRRL 2430 TaxID=1460371 RepID=A0A2P2FUC5_AMYLU|nr:hypothetical protein BB31_16110 [Amycolatopsis lurida NRRL 2430]